MKSRFLITTADERSWEMDRPAIFLGEWCCRPNRKEVWGAMDAEIAPPFYPDLKTRMEYANESNQLHDEIINNLTFYFNQIHNRSYDNRFWKILVGPFLTRYIRIVMNRYLTLEQCFNKYSVDQTIHLVSKNDLFPFDTLSLINLSENDFWNHELYIWLIKDFFSSELEIKPKQIEQVVNNKVDFTRSSIGQSNTLIKRFSKGIIFKIDSLLSRMNGDKCCFLYKTYLSRPTDILLSIYLKQIPCKWSVPEFDDTGQYDHAIVRKPFSGIISKKTKRYHYALEKYLHRIIPEVFLEKFTIFERYCDNLSWPKSPQFIFTGNAYDCDEAFKLWTAKKVNVGIRYMVAQPGASYGVNPFFLKKVEEETADRFITWGWKREENHTPGFCITTAGQRYIKVNESGGLLFIQIMLRRKKFIWDVHPEYNIYINNQIDFLNDLHADILKASTVRLHADYYRSHGDEYNIFVSNFPNIRIDTGSKRIFKIIKKFRLFVLSYDSTGLLEMLNMNIPVVAFWDRNGFDQISPAALKYYDQLIKVGILHFSPKSASMHVNRIWKDVGSWWKSDEVQIVRKLFCYQFAAIEQRPVKRLAKLLF